MHKCINVYNQTCREGGGFEGVRSNPPFGLQIILYAPLNLSALPFESGPLASMLLRITAVRLQLCEFVHHDI